MERTYIHYLKWEDWINGMWVLPKDTNKDYWIKVLTPLMSNHIEWSECMKDVIKYWPNTMLNTLSNKSVNRCAFLGQCACCYKLNAPNWAVKMVWKQLTERQRTLANAEADKHIKQWEKKYINIYTNGNNDVTRMGFQMSLQLK